MFMIHGSISGRDLFERLQVAHVVAGERHVVLLADIAFPSVPLQVLHEKSILMSEVLASHVGHEEIRDENTNDTDDGGDDKSPPVARLAQMTGRMT